MLTQAMVADAAEIADAWIRRRAMLLGVPGITYGIAYDGRIVLTGSLGVADVQTGTLATAQTAYRVASITKIFTATLVMQLVEQGKLRLDEPISSHLSWLDPAAGLPDITVRHLLTHSSGLIADGSCSWSGVDYPDRARLHQDVLARPVVAGPSAGFLYSNVAYALLGEIVEKLTGLSFDRALERHILAPLGLDTSGTRLTPERRRALATGYWRTPPGAAPRLAPDGDVRSFEPAAGLVSTVGDLLAFQAAHFRGDHRILGDLGKREMQRLQWQRRAEPHHGFGWMLWAVDGISLCGHSGSCAGFSAKIGFARDLRVAAVALTNTVAPAASLALDAAFHLIARVQALWDDSSRPPHGESRESLGLLAGRFADDWGERIVARVNHGLYLIDPDDDEPMLAPARLGPAGGGAGWIVAEHDDYGLRGERVSFELDESGRSTALHYGPRRLPRVAALAVSVG
jgi:D-alanyl-D-alanine carboxypeptidase